MDKQYDVVHPASSRIESPRRPRPHFPTRTNLPPTTPHARARRTHGRTRPLDDIHRFRSRRSITSRVRARRRDSLLTTTTTGREGAARGIRVTRDDDETTRAKNREGSLATARVPVVRENTDASIPNERWTDGDARAFIISSSSSDDKPSSTSKRNKMPSTQSVYVSMSILALTGLVGTGVAIGSGVSMMTMQMADAETQQKTAVAASVKETATRAPARGFAASGN